MGRLIRFGVSLEDALLARFDRLITHQGYANRSEAIRDLIRDALVKEQWRAGGKGVGAITLIYDHHQRELVSKLMDIQHDYHHLVVSSQHVHLDHHHCLEIIAVKGRTGDVKKLADALRAVKGVEHSDLMMSGTNL